MKRLFPVHSILGICLLLVSQFLLFKKVDPFHSWFYCFAWWSYIFAVDGAVYRLKGSSLIASRTREFLLMVPWSIAIWLIFEAGNLVLKNWYYADLPHSTVERWAGYSIAYGTVLPGIFETTELLESLALFRTVRSRRLTISASRGAALAALGASCLLGSLLFPEYLFCLIWVGFTLLLEPINYFSGGRSLLRDLEEGNPRKIYLLLCAGLVCGLLWEFWNFWALSRWIYTVPFFDRSKGFEMPFLGFLGFPPFAVEIYAMYNFVSLFRHQRGWEDSSYQVHPRAKTGGQTILVTVILVSAFFVLLFRAIDRYTVDSYYPRLADAYWIEPRYRAELPRLGIAALDDLIAQTTDKKERDELALRLMVPREELNGWIQKAGLARLKGMGIENVRILERAGIDSVTALARQDPDPLRRKIEALQDSPVPREAKLRVWINAARKSVGIKNR
jgi:hypothetical protein